MKYSEYARYTALAGAAGTLAGLLLWAGRPAPGDTLDRLLIAGVFMLPLVFAFIGLLRRRVYTAAWAAMLAVLYMSYTLAEYLVAGAHAGVRVTLGASALLFIGSALYPRLRSREGTARKPTSVS